MCLLCCEFSEEDLQGPPDKSKKDDKDDEKADEYYISPSEDEDGASALRVVPAPDLTKERERRKGKVTVHVEIRDRGFSKGIVGDTNANDEISDAADLFMLDQAKVIQKMVQEIGLKNVMIEETDPSDSNDIDELPPPPEIEEKELTSEELEAKAKYEEAAALLNKTRPDKKRAYQLLLEAAEKGNKDAKALVAWARLFGNPLGQDLEAAKGIFQSLADDGYPDGHTGLGMLEKK